MHRGRSRKVTRRSAPEGGSCELYIEILHTVLALSTTGPPNCAAKKKRADELMQHFDQFSSLASMLTGCDQDLLRLVRAKET